MKKIDIPVRHLSEEEMIENIEVENNIETSYKREWVLKTLAIIVWVIFFVYILIAFFTSSPTLEETRKETLRKTEIEIKYNKWEKERYEKLAEIYNLKINNLLKCKNNNSHTWFVFDCNLLNNKDIWK